MTDGQVYILLYGLRNQYKKMNKKRFTISITQGIAVMLLLIVGTGATSILRTTTCSVSNIRRAIFCRKGNDYNSERNWP